MKRRLKLAKHPGSSRLLLLQVTSLAEAADTRLSRGLMGLTLLAGCKSGVQAQRRSASADANAQLWASVAFHFL